MRDAEAGGLAGHVAGGAFVDALQLGGERYGCCGCGGGGLREGEGGEGRNGDEDGLHFDGGWLAELVGSEWMGLVELVTNECEN